MDFFLKPDQRQPLLPQPDHIDRLSVFFYCTDICGTGMWRSLKMNKIPRQLRQLFQIIHVGISQSMVWDLCNNSAAPALH